MKVVVDSEFHVIHVEAPTIAVAGWLGFEFAKHSLSRAWCLYYWSCGEFSNVVVAGAPVVELSGGLIKDLAAQLVGLIQRGPPVVCCCCPCHTRP